MDNSILEPISDYKNNLKEKFANNTSEYFENLVKKSGVNEEENIKTVTTYKKALENLAAANKKTRLMKILKYFLIVLSVILVICFAVFLYAAVTDSGVPVWAAGLISGVFIVLAIVCIVLLSTVIRKTLKADIKKANEIEKKCEEIKAEATEQMRPLNDLFDWSILSEIFNETTSLIKMDINFDAQKMAYLKNKYDLFENNDINRSTCMVQSGSILGNPFLIVKDIVHEIVDHVYTGTLTISWTEYRTNSKGERESYTRTEVLTASIVKPMPQYTYDTNLLYVNDAAPDLKFGRMPSGVRMDDSDRDIEKMVKHKEKEIAKLSKKAIKSGGQVDFTAMGNTEFDTLFGATNRTDEVQFRLLFTPLAQKNELSLIKDREFFGDDFRFEKIKRINVIHSEHSQQFDYQASPGIFINFDLSESRRIFNQYFNEYFKNLFFDLAPLLSIPLYQMNKPIEFIYDKKTETYYNNYEQETMANYIGAPYFQHPLTGTQSILKCDTNSGADKCDIIDVTAYSYQTVERVTYVPKMGGDGRMHEVPVYWTEYIPLKNNKTMLMRSTDFGRTDLIEKWNGNQFQEYFKKFADNKSVVFRKGLFAYVALEGAAIETKPLSQLLDK